MKLEQDIQQLLENAGEDLCASLSALSHVLVVNALMHDVSKKNFIEELGFAWDHYKKQMEKKEI